MTGTVLLILRGLLLASLYLFVGWALYTLWRDLKRQTELVSFVQTPALALVAADGSALCRVSKPEVFVGRDPACECTLDDITVSTQHARLSFHHHQWWAEDIGSTNGTFLNGERVTTPVVITSGDELRCGQVLLRVALGEMDRNEPER